MELIAHALDHDAVRGEHAIATLVLCVVALLLLNARRHRLHGTTLTGAWWWAVGSLVAIGSCETLLLMLPDETRATWALSLRFVAATSTFCPGVFVLGARRPHAGA